MSMWEFRRMREDVKSLEGRVEDAMFDIYELHQALEDISRRLDQLEERLRKVEELLMEGESG